MRRSLFTVTLFASAAMFGCEDGPNQTFSPAPTGAGNFLNSGGGDAQVDPGKQDFDANYPGKSLQEICSADEKRARWAKMVDEKIEPPRVYAGIDMAKSDKWEGIKVEEAEAINCQADNQGSGACPSGVGNCGYSSWGDNLEVNFDYNIGTHIVDQMGLNLGYTGTITFKDRSGQHTYLGRIGDVWRKDGQPFEIPFDQTACTGSGCVPKRNQVATELYNAMMFTFGPKAGIPWPPSADSKDCKADRGCLLNSDGGDGHTYFGVRPLAIYFRTRTGTPQPIISTPSDIYNFFVKTEPYSNLSQTLEISATGPFASGKVGAVMPQPTCTQSVGLLFKDLKKNCVQVTGDATADLLNLNKLIGGRQHDLENWSFNVVGVNQNFTKTQGPFDVVQDSDSPGDNDVATDWTFDVRARGQPSNDYSRATGDFEGRGIALVFTEWARLMLADTARIFGLATPKKLGDPTCAPAAADLDANGVLIPGRTLPAGCSGLEGLIIPSGGLCDATCANAVPLSFAGDPLNPGNNFDLNEALYDTSTSLSPGDPRGVFCNDPGTYSDCDTTDSSMYSTAVVHVQRVVGGGDINKVPAELRDRRYYFRWFGIALVRYLKAYGAAGSHRDDINQATGIVPAIGLTPTKVKNTQIDLESIFFDNSFGNLFDKVEYIERDFITSTGFNTAPWDYEYGTDVKFGNQRYQNWFHRLDREEVAMYTAMTVAPPNSAVKTDPPAKQNTVNLTNLFGSEVLKKKYSTYAKATAAATPRDLNGTKPAFSYYPGVWGKTVFSMGHSPITLKEADKLPNLGAAKVSIPNYLDPHAAVVPSAASTPEMAVAGDAGLSCVDGNTPMGTDGGAGGTLCCPVGQVIFPGSGKCCPAGQTLTNGICDMPQATGGALTVLVPWIEQQPGIGFSVPVNGSRDKQITTAQFDFTGNLETYLVDYEPWQDPIKPACTYDKTCNAGFTCDNLGRCIDGTIKIDAIEASDFLGEVFPCLDPATKDLLRVRQFDSALVIVDWLATHPGAQAACDIVIRYSPYNNYIDFITSRANGVKMSINAGQGIGRVVDVTLFDPAFTQQ